MLVHVTSHAGIVHFLAGVVVGMVFAWIVLKVRPDDA